MESLTLNKYLKLMADNYKIIVYFAVSMVIIAILAGIFVYRPSYESGAKLMIKETFPSRYVVPLEENSRFITSQNINPVLNYMEIFSAETIAANVAELVKDDPFLGQYPSEQMARAVKNSLRLKNVPGTYIIDFSFRWKSPDEAQKIARAYIESFIEHNTDMNRTSVSQMKNYIETQLEQSETELKKVRDRIKEYKKANKSVNVDQEAIAIIQQIAVSENDLAEIKKQLNSEKRKSVDLSEKIGLDAKNAVISTALGQNANLQSLRRDLQVAQQKYAELNARYTPLNPQIISLNETIAEIKNQAESQVKLTIGNAVFNGEDSIIADPVRTEMVNQLVQSQSIIESLDAQKTSVEKNLEDLRNKQSSLPEVQATLQGLIQNEATLSTVVETLNTKLIEAKIRESEIISNLTIIDYPSLPEKPSFPTILHLVLLFGFTGTILGMAVVIGKHFVEDTAQGYHEIEEIIKAPVLGVIPWIKESSYKLSPKDFDSASIINIVYQKINTILKIKCMRKQINIIGITSADFEKRSSVISANIAKSFAKSGNSVLMIDADFRSGRIAKEFDIDMGEKKDLADILLDISNKVNENKSREINEAVSSGIIKIDEYKNLFVIPNKNYASNPYEIISIPFFADLVGLVKERFDYIIIDTPPLLAVSDSITISQYVDGLILLCGIKTSRSNLAKIEKICGENYIDIIGAVARDSATEMDIPENMYIRQLTENFE